MASTRTILSRHTERGLCADMDPRLFDGVGTPRAWAACRACLIQPACLRDAINLKAQECYQGGATFGRRGGVPMSGESERKQRRMRLGPVVQAERERVAREHLVALAQARADFWLRLHELGVSPREIATKCGQVLKDVEYGIVDAALRRMRGRKAA